MSAWIEGRVAGTRRWTESLCSIGVEAPSLSFAAGQFARLALPAPPGAKEPMIARPYSFVNPPHAAPHEFYFIILPEGPLSPRLAALDTGASVWLAPRASGLFGIAETAQSDSLWCVSTGTGIGPFLSILRSGDPWTKFGRVVLVHSVRYAEELTYRDEIARIAGAHPGAFDYVPMVSREAHPDALAGRIPAAIEDGRLEGRVGLALTPENAHAMLCGNPAMVDDVQAVLGARGMRRHRRREPGHITLETYW
ncbi:MAG: ferredoxin--NADP reductase [Proteobacteria bacterium]|jgi:ferredoxin--NADP+ reductase|nr:ferredoxin--NADP reductase [Pseudomonadota bacterium]